MEKARVSKRRVSKRFEKQNSEEDRLKEENNYIDVRIPWEPNKRLGYACNRMFKTVSNWGLILDWDVFLLNVNWYDLMLNAIKKVPNAGLISCRTSRIYCPLQKYDIPRADTDNIATHINISETVEQNYSGSIVDVTDYPYQLSGFLFLTRRKVWDEVGGVPDDMFLGMDNEYSLRVKMAGYRIYIMQDLYVFHNYKRQWKED